MQEQLIDLSFLQDVSDNDPTYIYEVLEIFLNTMPLGLDKLQNMISAGEPWDSISKQAHSLKSSVSVIKIRGIYDQLAEIEHLTRDKNGDPAAVDKEKVVALLNNIFETFRQAYPLLVEEKEKNKS